MNVQEISLDLSKAPAVAPVVTIGQGDTGGTTIRASVYDNGAAAGLSGMSAMFEMRLPDGRHYVRDGSCAVAGNVIEYVVDEAACASVAGVTDEAYFDIMQGPSVAYSTGRFRVRVLRSARDGAEMGESWDSDVDALIRRGGESLDACDAAEALRAAAESGRVTAEQGRASAESGRASAETERASAEAGRAAAESGRAAAESARASSETERRNNETSRKSYETQRRNAESARESAESAREVAEAKRVADFADMEQRAKGWLKYYCGEGEYDPVTRKPTIASPDNGTLYYVPVADPDDDNRWTEWMWDSPNSRWELNGTTEASVVAVTTGDIDAVMADEAPTGSKMLNLTGLSYWWARLKAAFAAIGHKHAASDITSGTLGVARGGTGQTTAAGERNRLGLGNTTGAVPVANGGTGRTSTASGAMYATSASSGLLMGALPVAQGGTGATSAAAARANLGVNAANVVDGNAISPASVTATGTVKAATVEDSGGTLAALRESVSRLIPLQPRRAGGVAFDIWETVIQVGVYFDAECRNGFLANFEFSDSTISAWKVTDFVAEQVFVK